MNLKLNMSAPAMGLLGRFVTVESEPGALEELRRFMCLPLGKPHPLITGGTQRYMMFSRSKTAMFIAECRDDLSEEDPADFSSAQPEAPRMPEVKVSEEHTNDPVERMYSVIETHLGTHTEHREDSPEWQYLLTYGEEDWQPIAVMGDHTLSRFTKMPGVLRWFTDNNRRGNEDHYSFHCNVNQNNESFVTFWLAGWSAIHERNAGTLSYGRVMKEFTALAHDHWQAGTCSGAECASVAAEEAGVP